MTVIPVKHSSTFTDDLAAEVGGNIRDVYPSSAAFPNELCEPDGSLLLHLDDEAKQFAVFGPCAADEVGSTAEDVVTVLGTAYQGVQLFAAVSAAHDDRSTPCCAYRVEKLFHEYVQQLVGTFVGTVVDTFIQRCGAAGEFLYREMFHVVDWELEFRFYATQPATPKAPARAVSTVITIFKMVFQSVFIGFKFLNFKFISLCRELMSTSWLLGSKLKYSPTLELALLHRLRGDAFQREAACHIGFEFHFGAEHNLVPLDHGRGREIRGGHGILRIALAAQTNLQTAEVLQHYCLTGEECSSDEGFDTAQDSHGIGTRHGGAVVDVVGEVFEGVVTGLDGTSMEILGPLNTIRILGFSYCIVNCHSSLN